jgi:hypothetical protein
LSQARGRGGIFPIERAKVPRIIEIGEKMRANAIATMAILCSASVTTWSIAGPYDDNFDDNATAPKWQPVIDHPASLNLIEQNQRLELISNAGTDPNDDAIYLSNASPPFRLSTASNFEIAIDYSFTQISGTPVLGSLLGLVFGVGRYENDGYEDGTDSAAIGYLYTRTTVFGFPVTGGGIGVGHRTDDTFFDDATQPLAPTTGTFVISYDAAGDDLAFKREGDATLFTLYDTVQAIWGASELLVSFGGRGSGFTTQSGDAFLDNFVVRSGVVVPEPASLGLIGLSAIAMLRRQRR